MKILLISDLIIPTFNIGIVRPFLELKMQDGISLRMEKPAIINSKDIDWCDVAIFCRSQDLVSFNVFKKLKIKNKLVIYDIDDNFFELPLDSALSYYHRKSEHIYTLEYFLVHSDIVTVYSTSLQEKALEYNSNVRLLKCYFDQCIIQDSIPEPSSDRIKIAYATGRNADSETEKPLEDALVDVLSKYGSKVELHFWREPFDTLKNHKSVIQHAATPNYESFIRDFYKLGIDIGLAPLADGVFYNSKTNNKYREYSGCGIAGIYSNVSLYQSCIIDNENGVLANNTKNSWFNAIERLLLSRELRDKLSNNAKLDVDENYSFQNAVSQWRSILKELESRNIPTALSEPIIEMQSILYVYLDSDETEISNASYKLLQNIFRNSHRLFPQVREKKVADVFFEKYYGRVVCWYVCNGKSDEQLICELSEKFKYLIVDLNKFKINNTINRSNIHYIHQDDSLAEAIINGNVVSIPSQLSTMRRGKNTSEYVFFHFIDRFNINGLTSLRNFFDSFFLQMRFLKFKEIASIKRANIKSKYFTNTKLKIKSTIMYQHLKYKIGR
ncbi:glycosyltransferase [Vibrio aestuarianus]|uniref:glycosyltransferase n=1 Tax=Vibrio aestuarianus TaxID=28171 RepID=UPI00237CF629|nr:glycosyltransferase [Vibrio aestuarianus]MDE1330743.1 glycosyltransferase [Vibrio aestuarianus]